MKIKVWGAPLLGRVARTLTDENSGLGCPAPCGFFARGGSLINLTSAGSCVGWPTYSKHIKSGCPILSAFCAEGWEARRHAHSSPPPRKGCATQSQVRALAAPLVFGLLRNKIRLRPGRHPEGPRFLQRAEGSRAQPFALTYDPPRFLPAVTRPRRFLGLTIAFPTR
jgi:hypothetical protein